MPVVASTVRIQRGKYPVAVNDLPDPLKTAFGAFLLDKEHRVVFAGGIVHGNHEIPEPSSHPLVPGAVLMQHHADIGGPGTLPVSTLAGCFDYHPRSCSRFFTQV